MTSDFAARSRQFKDALDEAFAGSDEAFADSDGAFAGSDEAFADSDGAFADSDGADAEAGALDTLAGVVERSRTVAGDYAHVVEALDVLDAIAGSLDVEAALSEAAALFESPQRFREALFFARCLDRDAASTLELMHARGYVAGAVVPVATYPDLAGDQAAVLDATTFAHLWRGPSDLASMLETADRWRREYLPAYQTAHAAFNEAVAAIAQDVDARQTEVELLENLNRLRKLGAPLMEIELTKFHELEQAFACPANAEHLAEALHSDPICAECGFRLGDVPPIGDAQRVGHAIERGLGMQQLRLAQRVVPRLAANPSRRAGDNLDRFIEAVQGGDFTALARVLDEGFLGFIDDLLDAPEPRINLIERLSREHPEITPENLDAAVESFRRIAADEVARNGGRVRIGVEEEPV